MALYEYFPIYIIGGLFALLLLWCFCVYCWAFCEVMFSSPDEENTLNTEQIIPNENEDKNYKSSTDFDQIWI